MKSNFVNLLINEFDFYYHLIFPSNSNQATKLSCLKTLLAIPPASSSKLKTEPHPDDAK